MPDLAVPYAAPAPVIAQYQCKDRSHSLTYSQRSSGIPRISIEVSSRYEEYLDSQQKLYHPTTQSVQDRATNRRAHTIPRNGANMGDGVSE